MNGEPTPLLGKAPLTALAAAAFPCVTHSLQVNATFTVTDSQHDAEVRAIIDAALTDLHKLASTFQHKHDVK